MPVLNINVAENETDSVVIKDASDDTIVRVDTVNKRLVFADAMWDDVRAPATTIRQGASTKPDFDTTNMGLLFPQNDTAEVAYIILQLPHGYKQGSDISPHIHYSQDEVELPVFKMLYRWYNMGDAIPAFSSAISFTDFGYTYSSGTLHQRVGTAADLDGTGKKISSIVEAKLYRDDNVVTGDVLVKEFDLHIQLDTYGSENIGKKA